MKKIENVAVLGSGVMGSQIAAHLTNAGYKVFLFDMDQKLCEKGIDFCKNLKPAPFYNPKNSSNIIPQNYNDHLESIKNCDWIIEVIAEKLEWKQELYKKILPFLKDDAVVTSNTSGLLVKELTDGMDNSFKERFFVTHFFNPPRYMKLVEIVPGSETKQDYIDLISDFLTNQLGKGVVRAKDTPNFIANRIGVFGMMVTLQETINKKLSIEDVDALTGTLIGRPKSATYRTADIVGLDTLTYVAKTAYDKGVNDNFRNYFKLPEFIESMISNGWLGQKSKQGFYKKIEKGVIHSLDFETMDYTPQNKKRYKGVGLARENTNINSKLRALVNSEDIAGEFTWEVFSKTLLYASYLVGEISDDIISIDNALKWGFGWEVGPFEVWDALGFEKTLNRMKEDRKEVPAWINEMCNQGSNSFYKVENGKKYFYSFNQTKYLEISKNDSSFSFQSKKDQGLHLNKNWSASIVDLEDGVAGVEFHSVLQSNFNPIDGSLMQTIAETLSLVKDQGYKGIVISSDATHFSAGANLNLILNAAENNDWDSIDNLTSNMQKILQSVRFSNFPVVVAPFGMVLGGGYEVVGACDRVVAAAELYCGLVEVGVGLIPGAGGNLRLISKLEDEQKTIIPGNFQVVKQAFETIAFAKVSFSANHAKSLGYLTSHDKIIVNKDHILSCAKNEVLKMSEDYNPPKYKDNIKLPGKTGRLAFESTIKGFVKSGKISEHDALIGRKLAFVLTGGDKGGPMSGVDEQYLLDIERETFLSLCGEEKSKARISHMLKTSKPLRN
ncbi:MAG: 3-hydroxyacyl-CoA dehydrogenase [Candidatus Marinimicrobia bacterium]|nr:3-hydroxyacyl-CoA dehydrogenase [Candidatus Neomarinimicrobiota bacterium]